MYPRLGTTDVWIALYGSSYGACLWKQHEMTDIDIKTWFILTVELAVLKEAGISQYKNIIYGRFQAISLCYDNINLHTWFCNFKEWCQVSVSKHSLAWVQWHQRRWELNLKNVPACFQ